MRPGKANMPRSDQLIALLTEYAHLSLPRGRWASDDQTQSLRYYEADIAIATGTAPAESSARITHWLQDVRALEEFIESTGHFPQDNRRLPRSAFAPEHLRLITWVGTQRRATDVGRRCDYQIRRLGCIAGYIENSVENLWMTRFGLYRSWLESAGAPRYRSSDPSERRLADWAAKQRAARRNGRLPVDHAELLESLGTWTWGE